MFCSIVGPWGTCGASVAVSIRMVEGSRLPSKLNGGLWRICSSMGDADREEILSISLSSTSDSAPASTKRPELSVLTRLT